MLKSLSVPSPPPTRDKAGEGLSNCCDIKSACQDQAKSASWNLLSLHEIWRAFSARGCLPEHHRSTASRLSLGRPLLVIKRGSVIWKEKRLPPGGLGTCFCVLIEEAFISDFGVPEHSLIPATDLEVCILVSVIYLPSPRTNISSYACTIGLGRWLFC